MQDLHNAQKFGGPAAFIDRSDINTDEIIPARYLTEISKAALGPHLLEDLHLEGRHFDPKDLAGAKVLVTRSNFGCGSSREHAVWALEVNDIKVVGAESWARSFRQNMFNCGILAVELARCDLERLFALGGRVTIAVGVEAEKLSASSDSGESLSCSFTLNPFDRQLVAAGGWLAYADAKY